MAKGQMEGDKLLNLEKQIVRASKKRFDWIIKLIKNFSDKNILVYFEDVKGGYGKRLYERIKEESENIGVYYIDESVPASAREYFKKKLEETSGNVLFATWQTWSTGESVKNLHVVICVEPVKDEVILSQGMGRPMRLHSSKDKFLWIDIVDDLSVQVLKKDESGFETFQNYFNKWLSFRLKYYEKEFFQVKITKIDLTKL
jgi:superfamily II DNA or RNA helicase